MMRQTTMITRTEHRQAVKHTTSGGEQKGGTAKLAHARKEAHTTTRKSTARGAAETDPRLSNASAVTAIPRTKAECR